MAAKKNEIAIFNRTQQSIICTSAVLADTFLSRLLGLLGRRRLAEDSGLLIRPCSGVHTFAMRFAIDIVALDRNDCVIAAFADVAAWKLRALSIKTRSVLELPSGAIIRSGLSVGDQLEVHARG